MSTRILTVVGARPQFIKAAVVSRAFAQAGVEERIVHTGQHYDPAMSGRFFEELEIPEPAHHLGLGGGNHGAMTGRMLEAIEAVILQEMPECVLVYGDTNSTLAGALAAVKLHVPVAHVEAGLRSFNRRMPEEINRVLTDHASDRLYAPTATAVKNLVNEGIQAEAIREVGDVMYDATLFFGKKASEQSQVLGGLGLKSRGYVLATVHRAENTDDPSRLAAIVGGLSDVARDLPVVLPLHPRTRKSAGDLNLDMGAITIIDPVGYLDMAQLEQHAAAIATDSGGVQKEAFFAGVPCVTLRDETEWVELVELGWNRLAPPHSAQAVANAVRSAIGSQGQTAQPYGDGKAGERIAADLLGSEVRA